MVAAQPRGEPEPSAVTVVIITRDRRDELLHTLGELARLPERPPVIVVDNASTDDTVEAVRRHHPDVRVIAAPRNLGAVGRNEGALAATTRYVAFADDDTWWEPGSLARATAVLDAHPRVAVVCARILVEPGGREDPINAELAHSPLPLDPELPGVPIVSFLGGASVVRRSAFLGVGGFHPRLLIGGEEELLSTDLAVRGWQLLHLPELIVHHHPSTARDAHLRRRQGIRNALWYWWLRRPVRSAVRRTWRMARDAPRDLVSVGGFVDALRGAPWVVRERRVVPPAIEQRLALMDLEQVSSKARRYVS